MEQILPAYGVSKETVTAIMMLYIGIFNGVLQGGILASYLFRFCRDYVLRTSIVDLISKNK